MHTDPNCLFCKIAAGQIPASKVYEDARFLAFRDIHPAAPVHLLLVPKHHIASLADATDADADWLGAMMALAPKLMREHGGAGGFKTQINTGPDGGQEVMHLHLHLLGGPRPWGKGG